MRKTVGLYPDELPIADWLNTRVNQPPPGATWDPGATKLLPTDQLAFDTEAAPALVELLDIYIDTSDDDHDLNPQAVNAALRLREKIVEESR